MKAERKRWSVKEDRLGYQLARTDHVMRMSLEKEMRALGLGLVSWGVLSWIVREPGLSTADLTSRVFASQQAVSRLVAGLLRAGLLERAPGSGHGSAHGPARGLIATKQGRAVSDAGERRVVTMERALRRQLGAADAERLFMLLRQSERYFKWSAPAPAELPRASPASPRSAALTQALRRPASLTPATGRRRHQNESGVA